MRVRAVNGSRRWARALVQRDTRNGLGPDGSLWPRGRHRRSASVTACRAPIVYGAGSLTVGTKSAPTGSRSAPNGGSERVATSCAARCGAFGAGSHDNARGLMAPPGPEGSSVGAERRARRAMA